MKKQYFFEDSYTTDTSKLASGFKGWFLRWRLVFIFRLVRQVFRSRRLALDGKYDSNEWAGSSVNTMHLLEISGAIFNISGFDNIRDLKKPVVFISNHMSTLETMVFPGLIAPLIDVTFVVKDSLVSYPAFGPIMRSQNPVVVSRNNSRKDLMVVLKEGAEKLAAGTSIVIFPQSTRRESFVVKEFNSLGVKLAERAGIQVVPVAIKTDYWKNGKRIKDLGPFDRSQAVNIEFGKAMDIDKGGKIAHGDIVKFITERLVKWGVEVVE